MKKFKLYNRIAGWGVFLISAVVYLMTVEPTTSLWDCGEFIASAFKLQVGHPPGAPVFMILARFFSLFAGNDYTKVALMVNSMSGIASALTIAFLFWTITHLALKIVKPIEGQYKNWQLIAIIGSGIVGSLAYTFSDTFWFSAVEGEVYASSSLFTAMVFWAILKWENVANEKYANRWIILIAFLMGLSIGVHLLNLLAIPAIVLVYYFKNNEPTRNGVIKALLVSFVILGSIMYIIIPGAVKIASWFELMFVNGFGLPFKSGLIFYLTILFSGLAFGIYITHKRKQYIANTILLAVTVVMIGYSSFAMIVIRSLANPPMDENSPETVFSLMYYLNREQYGDRPLVKGQYFNAQVTDSKEGKKTYTKIGDKYEVTDKKTEYIYDEDFKGLFPRMYSSDPSHVKEYLQWGGIKEGDVYQVKLDQEGQVVRNKRGEIVYDKRNPKRKPSFFENMKFFLSYQIGHMYFRYFMWNFSGRQNNIQGHGGPINGNWITGIQPIDAMLTGEPGDLPPEIKDNPSRNSYYLLPLILGLIGLYFHYNNQKKDFWVVMTLFFMTGIAIVIYLNQTPIQPRERDYAYAGSFYAFAIWIGLGVLGIIDKLGQKGKNVPATLGVSLISFLLVPAIMASENWDDHDRSGRFTARDIAYNYLNTCKPNAILFTNGDNDTFPLWYVQDVEGVRTDVRIVNTMLLNMDWYIDQMKRKAYESDPLPISIEHGKYVNGTRDMVYVKDLDDKAYNAKDIVSVIANDNYTLTSQGGNKINFAPARRFYLPVDSAQVISKGVVKAKDSSIIEDRVIGRISSSYMSKSDMIILDILANNNWERPIYYLSAGHSSVFGLEDYFQLEGLAYRLVPIKHKAGRYEAGRIDTDILYENLMTRFKYGRMEQPDVFLDNFHQRTMSIIRLRFRFKRLADEFIAKGDTSKAVEVLDRIVNLTPHENLPYDMFVPGIVESYYKAGENEKADVLFDKLLDISDQYLTYYTGFNESKYSSVKDKALYYFQVANNLGELAKRNKRSEQQEKVKNILTKYENKLRKFF